MFFGFGEPFQFPWLFWVLAPLPQVRWPFLFGLFQVAGPSHARHELPELALFAHHETGAHDAFVAWLGLLDGFEARVALRERWLRLLAAIRTGHVSWLLALSLASRVS